MNNAHVIFFFAQLKYKRRAIRGQGSHMSQILNSYTQYEY